MANLPPRAYLLGLPTELRLFILEYVFQDAEVKLYHPHDEDRKLQPVCSLVAVNHKLRSESPQIFHSSTKYTIMDGFTEQDLKSWLSTFPTFAAPWDLEFNCKARSTMYGLQPDSDYCYRSFYLTRRGVEKVDLYMDPNPGFALNAKGAMCSNDAFGCSGRTHNALREFLSAYTPPR